MCIAGHPERIASVEQAADYLRSFDISLVEAWVPDIHGTPRGKRFPTELFLEEVTSEGFSLANSIFCWTRHCDLSDEIPFSNVATGYPDLRVVPDLTTLRAMPGSPGRAVVVCAAQTIEGDPIPVDPRAVLRKGLDDATEAGYEVVAAMEYEFTLLRPDGLPVSDINHNYAVQVPEVEPFLEAVTLELAGAGLPVEASELEWGTGQLEVTLQPEPALAAADQAFLFKHLIKGVACRHGLIASFMPKPDAQQAGNGLHVNQSLWRDGRNLFERGESGAHYLAGLLEAAGTMLLLGAPTINAYKRLSPGSFAPTTNTWSSSSRTSAVRALFDRGPKASRIEYRIAGAEANPYAVLAGNLAAGMVGLRDETSPPPEYVGNSYLVTDERLQLPRTIEAALAEFSRADAYLGREFVEHYSAVVRREAVDFAAAVTDWERDRYLKLA